MSIQFPNLGINLDYVGKSIQIFGFEITFFGLVIALGMLLGMGFVILEAKRLSGNDDHIPASGCGRIQNALCFMFLESL